LEEKEVNVPVGIVTVLLSALVSLGGAQLALSFGLAREVAVLRTSLNEVRNKLGLPSL
jgi:hypothetical protein